MLQQTQVKTVIPYWQRWMRALPTIQSLAKARSEKVLKLWEGLGYYTRARNLQSAARFIVKKHGGQFPQTFDDMLALPGVGRYTAGAIGSIAFDQPAPIVDGNVARVLCRLFCIPGNPMTGKINVRLWKLAESLVKQAAALKPPSQLSTLNSQLNLACSHLNQSLMELGAVICTPRQPKCSSCPLRAYCVARRRGCTASLPHPSRRAAATARRYVAFVAERRGRFLVRQRPADGVNAHLWEFPNVEVDLTTGNPATAGAKRGWKLVTKKPLGVVRHSITRSRILLEAFPAQPTGRIRAEGTTLRWVPLQELRKLAFVSAHRRLLAALEEKDRFRS